MRPDSDHQSTNLMTETTLRPVHKGNGKKGYLVLTFIEKKKKMDGEEGDTCFCKIFLLMNLRAMQHDNLIRVPEGPLHNLPPPLPDASALKWLKTI